MTHSRSPVGNILLVTAVLTCAALLYWKGFSLEPFHRSCTHSLQQAAFKIQSTVSYPFHQAHQRLERLKIVWRQSDEIVQLKQQLNHATALSIELTEQRLENQRLRKLLSAAAQFEDYSPLWARVIGKKTGSQSNIFRINIGSLQGICVGDGVVNHQGIIGQVFSAEKNHSDVLLVSAPASSIDVLVQQTRARAMVKGLGKPDCLRVEDFDHLYPVHKGDILITSGLAGQFPKGLPVGRVLQTNADQNGVYLQADIAPFAHLSRIEDVLVLTKKELPNLP